MRLSGVVGRTDIFWPAFAAASLAAAPVLAGHGNTTVVSDARTTVGSFDGINAGGISGIWRNGAQLGSISVTQGGAGTATWTAGPDSPGSGTNFFTADTAASITSASSLASASIARGELKAVVSVDQPAAFFGSGGSAAASFNDAVWFTNSSGSAQAVTLSMRVDGAITGSKINVANGFSLIRLGALSTGCNTAGECITPDQANPLVGWTDDVYGDVDQVAGSFGFREQLSGQTDGDIPWWNFSFGAGHDPAAGLYDYTKSIQLWIPTGETTLVLGGEIRLDACNGSALVCDFGNTAAIRLGALPSGVSFTSQSGQFLTGLGGGTGAIPEPASWAMLIAGFGLVGAMQRRRATAIAA